MFLVTGDWMESELCLLRSLEDPPALTAHQAPTDTMFALSFLTEAAMKSDSRAGRDSA